MVAIPSLWLPILLSAVIVFLASSRAEYVTGQVLIVNGGISMVG